MTRLTLSPSPFLAISSERGLAAYLGAIKSFPMLSHEEEYRLAKRLEQHGDVDAAHKLVTSHMRLVVKIAMSARFYGVPVSDLISEGNIGLLRALKGFDADRGFRLATYATWWIKAAIYECILNSWSMVKVGTTTAQRKLFFNLRTMKAKLRVYQDGDIPEDKVKVIARDLRVAPSDVIEMNRRLAGPDASLNQPGNMVDETRQDLLVDPTPSPETLVGDKEERALGRRLLKDGLATLSVRERSVIEQRRLIDIPRTLEDIGADFGVSRERIRQIEGQAFKKLQAVVTRNSSSTSSISAAL